MKDGVMVVWKVGYLDDVLVELKDDEKVVWWVDSMDVGLVAYLVDDLAEHLATKKVISMVDYWVVD